MSKYKAYIDLGIVVNVLFYNLTENRNVLEKSKNIKKKKKKSFPKLKIEARTSPVIIKPEIETTCRQNRKTQFSHAT